MPKFVMQAEVNCGVTYEVEADTREQAEQIMQAAIVQHIDDGCDGVEINEVDDNGFVDLGVRIGKDSTGAPYPVAVPSGLEFYDRDTNDTHKETER